MRLRRRAMVVTLAALFLVAGCTLRLFSANTTGARGDLYFIVNRKSGKCLNAQGASTANGTDLIQYTCTWDWNSLFTWWPA